MTSADVGVFSFASPLPHYQVRQGKLKQINKRARRSIHELRVVLYNLEIEGMLASGHQCGNGHVLRTFLRTFFHLHISS
jgi:hypothetical protein